MSLGSFVSLPSVSLPSVSLWMLRVVWGLQPLVFVPLLGDAMSTLDSAGRTLAVAVLWGTWAAVLLATLVPSTVSLTGGRLAAPLAPVVVAVSGLGPDVAGWKIAAAAAATALAVLLWFSGEVGIGLVQGSAYGDEQRFPLKPPVPSLVPVIVFWLLTATTMSAGVIFVANESWIIGTALAAAGAGLTVFVAPRFHQFSRRWFVVVPVGLVVHDPMLLVENALFRAAQLQSVHLAPAGSEAADLTGGTAGAPIEIVLRELDTVVTRGRKDQPMGVALHVRSALVSPTRPGLALAAAARRNLPVG